MTDFAKTVDDFETACYALGDRGILEVGSDHMPADLLKQHETAMTALMAFAPTQEAAAPSEEPVAWQYRYRMWNIGDWSAWSVPTLDKSDSNDEWEWRPLFASPAVAPVAVSVKGLEQLAREIAVTMVDAMHGYTMEFAPSPSAHRDEYDRAESAARYALSSIIPATKGGEDALRRAWEYGRNSWCPAGIVKDNERTERDWREALAALSAQDSEAKS